MRTLREIVGLPVLLGGACIGHALKAETDEALTQVQTIWYSAGFVGARRIDRANVRQIGDVAIQVSQRGVRGRMAVGSFFRRAVSTDGARLGAVADAEFDDQLRICALWLTHGYPDDLLHGRRRITRYSVRQTDGCVLIPAGEEEQL